MCTTEKKKIITTQIKNLEFIILFFFVIYLLQLDSIFHYVYPSGVSLIDLHAVCGRICGREMIFYTIDKWLLLWNGYILHSPVTLNVQPRLLGDYVFLETAETRTLLS